MPIFLDRLPLQSREVHFGGRRQLAWYALLPVVVTEPELREPPANVPCQFWKLDTGCAPDASAWRFHIERAGLDLSDPGRLVPRPMKIRLANDAVEVLPVRKAALWLVSNIPALRDTPHRLSLFPGLPYYDRAPRRPESLFPLIGTNILRWARLKVEIDFAAATLSVRTPGPWHRGASLFLRRLPGRFATIPPEQLCADG